MAGILKISFDAVVDAEPSVYDAISFNFNGSPLIENLSPTVFGYQYFKFENSSYGTQLERRQRVALNFLQAFIRDYKDVGGSKNFTGTISGTEVTLLYKKGQITDFFYGGDNLIVTEIISDTVDVEEVLLSGVASESVGDCTTIQYSLTASGGVQPYIVRKNGLAIITGWNGTSSLLDLERGILHGFSIYDSSGLNKSITINVPRNIIASEFSVTQTQQISSSDLLITNTNPIFGTTPISYSLNDIDYQVDSNFAGIPEGDYTLYIKDKYNCIVSKIIVVQSFVDPNDEFQYNYLKVSSLNSLAFSPCTEFSSTNKKNFENTLSRNEYVGIPYKAVQKFCLEDIDSLGIGTQFKSSYPFHVVTIHSESGKQDLAPILIQQNLGTYEKVDVKLTPIVGGIGVYFDGGNLYEPNTTTVIGASPHTKYLPDWAKKGQFVSITTLGVKEIIGFGYDSNLDRDYFIVSGSIGANTDAIAQIKYDIQPYNLFEFYFQPSQINGRSIITIESGYSFDKISKRMISECFEIVEDSDDLLLFEWSGFRNIGDMVFQSGITGVMRIQGKMRPYAKGEAELSETDSGSYSLVQKSFLGQRVYIPMATPRIWDKINDITGISTGGTLKINGLEVVRNKPIETEEKGDSNVSDITIEFDYGSNSLAIQDDEIVYNVSTGIVGGGSGIGEEIEIPEFDGKTRLVDDLGNFITVEGFFIEVN